LTKEALISGADVVYQGFLEQMPFRGLADFLVKVPNDKGNSLLGDFHYEVWDTKLSRQAKPHFVIQLCCYADMLYDIQGCYADEMAVVLGNNEIVRFRLDDYRFYYAYLKKRFLDQEGVFDISAMPDPAECSDWGRWAGVAQEIFESCDHLNQIANISRSQIKALTNNGITTATELAGTKLKGVNKISQSVFERLQAQSKMQIKTRVLRSQGISPPAFEVVMPKEGEARGLALLPPASSLDVFFDIEGYPLIEGGLEYLWGNTYFEDNTRQFKDFWAHDEEQEKACFQAFISWVYDRWQKDPLMHIYHYASYEITACRKLMGKYGVCEKEVDDLLRNEIFVDLYTVVRHGVLVGEPSYSIKYIEHLYRPERQTDVGSGGDSVVVYEQWRENPDGKSWEDSQMLNGIREYNKDDCDSTQELADWLRKQQLTHNIDYVGNTEVKEQDIPEEVTNRILLRDRLLDVAEKEQDETSADMTETLAWMLEFHRRENKPSWWRLFDRLASTEEELVNDLECIAQCQRTETAPFKPTERARNLAYEYSFDKNQELKSPGTGKYVSVLYQEDMKPKLLDIDTQRGVLTLQSKEEPASMVTLIPNNIVGPKPIPESIEAVVEGFEDTLVKDQDASPENAITDFLLRRVPRIKGHHQGPIIKGEGDRLVQVTDAVLNLDHSYLCIQGPPGTGKTFTGKLVIAELVKRGLRVGICSNSHKAINNLLLGVAETCKEKGIAAQCYCTSDTGPEIGKAGIGVVSNNQISALIQPACVIGTTAWGFSRDDVAGQFDYLFVDEAGQVALANLVGISRAAQNLVIMGDQMQLGQPIQGSHPGDSGQSVLEYLLQDHATIPDDLGIFLGTTYRMHPEINRFISQAIYEGRLNSDPDNEKRIIAVPDQYAGELDKEAGIVFVGVEHEGNVQASKEEAEKVKELADELLGRTFTDKDGATREIGWDDILFVAPYNYQVNTLQNALGKQAKVGSVDRFQGQEAPVVILSLAASDATESPRGLRFLLDKNRLNVAISRAQSLAIVVANPSLIQNFHGSIDDMVLANLFARLLYECEDGA
jgi:predicted RecB family nuclease